MRPLPAAPVVPGMVYIPAGTFLAGEDKKPATLNAFFIDETEVSNADFCKAMGCSVEPGKENLPKVGITVAEARAYAKQIGKRLPTSRSNGSAQCAEPREPCSRGAIRKTRPRPTSATIPPLRTS